MEALPQNEFLRRLILWWQQKAPHIKLYVGGGLLLATSFLIVLVVPKAPIGTWTFTFAFACLSLGIFRECYDVVVGTKDRPLAKLGVAILTVMSAAAATGSSSGVVAIATGQDPSYFKTAIAFLSPLAFIPVFAIAAFGLSILGLLFALLLGVREKRNISAWLLLARMAGLIGIMAFSETVLKADGYFSSFINSAGAYSAYLLDMHEDPACSEAKGDRVARLNDSVVILGRMTDEGPQFVRRACELAPEARVLGPPRK